MNIKEPTTEQCTHNAIIDRDEYSVAYAIWYPQMGGYIGKAVVIISLWGHTCFDVFVWHDGEYPFTEVDGNPRKIHHCVPDQFINFGETIEYLQTQSSIKRKV